jgi:type IV secretion system protein VirB9
MILSTLLFRATFSKMITQKTISSILLIFAMFFCNLLANQELFASQTPRFLGSEKKFRSYIYNPNEVYRYIGHYTYQGFIEFEAGESISTISMGNPTLWMFEHLDNRLFLKPIGEDNSETNMTIITNKRIYHFELAAKEAKGINDQDLIFVAKFSYPEDQDKNILEFAKSNKSDAPDLRDLSIYNFDYQYVGDNNITPLRVFDNNKFTYFQFSSKNGEIPAIFTIDSSGYESLINFRSTGDYIIVEQIAPQFILRSGFDIVCIYNTRLYNQGKVIGGMKQSSSQSIDKTNRQVPIYQYQSQNKNNLSVIPTITSKSSPMIDSNINLNNKRAGNVNNDSYGSFPPAMPMDMTANPNPDFINEINRQNIMMPDDNNDNNTNKNNKNNSNVEQKKMIIRPD